MNDLEVLVSRLAFDQLGNLTSAVGRAIVQAIMRLADFPESSPVVDQRGYEHYRQLIVRDYRVIYRYFPDDQQVRIYCVLHVRRRLPPSEYLFYQLF